MFGSSLKFSRPTAAPLLVYGSTLILAGLAIMLDFEAIKDKKLEIVIAVLTTGVAVSTYLVNKSHTETQIFLDLFRAFNERFDRLNVDLNGILFASDLNADSELNNGEKGALYDYFNLCAEEYYFYKAGYIDERTWIAWRAGMRHFWKCQRIQRFWNSELTDQSTSYYGFTIDILTTELARATP